MTRRNAGRWVLMITGFLSLIAIGNGCHKADRYVLTSDSSVPVEQLFLLTVQGDSVQKANGFSRVPLMAQVLDVSEGGRTILFTTTAGSLRVGNRTRTDSLFVETDLQGMAKLELISPSKPAVAQVIATIEGLIPALTQQRNIQFTPVTAKDVLAFEGLSNSVVVETTPKTDIQVRIDPSLEGDDRYVTFSTNLGRFLFGTGTNSRTRRILADQSGMATVTLESPTAGGEAVVTAAVRGFTLEETIRFFVQPSISFVGPPRVAPADGVTLTRFSVLITSQLERAENLNVEFVTTAGTLISGLEEGQRLTVAAGKQDSVAIFLRSPRQVGAAVVTATLGSGPKQERTITFDLAPPDSVIVRIDPNKFLLRPNEQTTLQAVLTRNIGRGKVSEGLRVSFAAADSQGAAIPFARFLNVTLADTNGIATAIFTPDGSAYRGLVTLRATYTDASVNVVGTATVRIVDE